MYLLYRKGCKLFLSILDLIYIRREHTLQSWLDSEIWFFKCQIIFSNCFALDFFYLKQEILIELYQFICNPILKPIPIKKILFSLRQKWCSIVMSEKAHKNRGWRNGRSPGINLFKRGGNRNITQQKHNKQYNVWLESTN